MKIADLKEQIREYKSRIHSLVETVDCLKEENAILKKRVEELEKWKAWAKDVMIDDTEKLEQAESRLQRLREAVERHRSTKLYATFESELLPSDRELYEMLKEVDSELK